MANGLNRKVIWVIGAGFSRSLGGPLLDEIFDQHRLDAVKALYWRDKPPGWDDLCQRWNAIAAFHNRRREEALKTSRRTPWRDAEEFVEMLEAAALGRKQAQRVFASLKGGAAYGDRSWASMARDAKAYLAALMCEFISVPDMGLEKWEPYQAWTMQLQPDDEVVSFNYDLVVDYAMGLIGPHPKEQIDPEVVEKVQQRFRAIKHHRLHGHVREWFVTVARQRTLCTIDDPFDGFTREDMEVAIGVPGPSKVELSTNALGPRWLDAVAALESASAIVFVGFRFPPTDSYARRILLNAIRNNPRDFLSVHVVLGPVPGPDTERLEGLLGWALSHRRRVSNYREVTSEDVAYVLRRQPLWAEDFMSIFERDRLIEDC